MKNMENRKCAKSFLKNKTSEMIQKLQKTIKIYRVIENRQNLGESVEIFESTQNSKNELQTMQMQ